MPQAADSDLGQDCGVEVVSLQRGDVIDRHSYYQPVYRIDLWRRLDPPPDGDAEIMGYKQDSYRIRGAKSVREVRSWAEENAAGRQFVIWIELGRTMTEALRGSRASTQPIRKNGTSPTSGTSPGCPSVQE
jgi:hypothetical protein